MAGETKDELVIDRNEWGSLNNFQMIAVLDAFVEAIEKSGKEWDFIETGETLTFSCK